MTNLERRKRGLAPSPGCARCKCFPMPYLMVSFIKEFTNGCASTFLLAKRSHLGIFHGTQCLPSLFGNFGNVGVLFLRVIKLIQDHAVDSSSSPFVREIWELIRRPWRTLFTWVPREGNLAADALAKQPSLPNYSMQRYEAPDFLQAVLRRDIHGPH
ncbi:hypothetical protein V6N12_050805 [Hibiscus sabdariffa]|uniref:RNase H type-1 domain-containing protein n=1 Tax=Hibiscus sabdariffa TaxID=183260 RepID=A0ABR2GE37_9ROSI